MDLNGVNPQALKTLQSHTPSYIPSTQVPDHRELAEIVDQSGLLHLLLPGAGRASVKERVLARFASGISDPS